VSTRSNGVYDGTSKVPAFEIRWKATNLPLPAESGSRSNRLSKGAIAGIVIGAVAAVAIGVAAFLLLRRYRRRRLSPIYVETAEVMGRKAEAPGEPEPSVAVAELTPTTGQVQGYRGPSLNQGVPGVPISELPASGHAAAPNVPSSATASAPAPDRRQIPTHSSSDEIALLMEKKARVEERRRRLLELEQLDSEADAIDQRLVMLRGQGGG
jgi:hypothetical protein